MNLKSITLATCVALGGTLMAMSEKNGAAASVAAATAKQQTQADAWDKVFAKSDKVEFIPWDEIEVFFRNNL